VAALTSTFNIRLKSTAEAKNEVIAMKNDKLETMVEKSETTIEVAATSHAARTGLPT
jgi:hypothetical protein